jgi:hypothetical protein
MVDGRLGREVYGVAVAGLVVLLSTGTAHAVGALADADARKAATKCQALIAKTTAKALASKLKAYDGCAAAALACVQTKLGKPDCGTKAAATCTKKLASAASAAVKAKDKIAGNKSCLALSTADLLGSDGLGFGDIAGVCSADFGLNVCEGLEPIAECLITAHDRDAGALLAHGLPRTGELLADLPGAPLANTNGLPPIAGCGTCNVQESQRKAVEKCGKALGTGTQALASALEAAFGACTLALYDCAQNEADAPACIGDATGKCTKAAAKVTKAVAKLGAGAAKSCGTDFTSLSQPGGLNLDALAPRCVALGVPTLDSSGAFVSCLAAEAKCAVASLVRTALPRTKEFLDAAQAGGLTADLAATCPTATGLQTAATLKSFRAAGNPRGVFGTILKLVKSVKRAVPSAVAVKTTGGKPTPSGNTTAGVSKVNGPKKVTFGSVHKYTVTYHGNRTRAGGGRGGMETPNLIVTVSRDDIVLDDHFEIPTLTLPPDGTDVDDELDIEFADSIPACAFDLAFATKTGDGVSGYTALPQVVEEDDVVTVPPSELASTSTGGAQQDAGIDGTNVAISATGRYVAFTTPATNLMAPADTNGLSDLFVRDRCVSDGVPISGCTPGTTRESLGPGNEPFHDGTAGRVGISDDGRFIAFTVVQENDPNPPVIQSFIKDRCLSNGETVDVCIVTNTDATFDGETFQSGGQLTSLSSDGRFVVFTTTATSFGGGELRVFLYDNCFSSSDPVFGGCEPYVDRVSDSAGGGVPDGDSDWGAVSRNGRFIAYRSDGSNVLPTLEDTNGANDVFLHDTCFDPATGTNFPACAASTVRVNLTPAGLESDGDDPSTPPLTNVAVSDDGRYVAYTSTADDLLGPGVDTNGKRDVFVYDRCLEHGTAVGNCTPGNERVNLGPNGTESNGDIPGGFAISMSANGRLVVFASDATNLLGNAVGAPNGTAQVFMRDRCLDKGFAIPGCVPATTLVSIAPDGAIGNGSSDRPAIAAGGSATAFISAAANLLGPGGDTNDQSDAFVRDR